MSCGCSAHLLSACLAGSAQQACIATACVPLPAQQSKQGLGVQGAKDEEASTFYVLEIGNCDVFVSSTAS